MTRDSQEALLLRTLGWLDRLLVKHHLDYWVFGGWAVDLYAGRVTRPHSDIDVAIWYEDLEQINALLTRADWVHRPEPGEDGYTGYERGGARLELASSPETTWASYTRPWPSGEDTGHPNRSVVIGHSSVTLMRASSGWRR